MTEVLVLLGLGSLLLRAFLPDLVRAVIRGWTALLCIGLADEIGLRRRAETESYIYEERVQLLADGHSASEAAVLQAFSFLRGLLSDVTWRLTYEADVLREGGAYNLCIGGIVLAAAVVAGVSPVASQSLLLAAVVSLAGLAACPIITISQSVRLVRHIRHHPAGMGSAAVASLLFTLSMSLAGAGVYALSTVVPHLLPTLPSTMDFAAEWHPMAIHVFTVVNVCFCSAAYLAATRMRFQMTVVLVYTAFWVSVLPYGADGTVALGLLAAVIIQLLMARNLGVVARTYQVFGLLTEQDVSGAQWMSSRPDLRNHAIWSSMSTS
jgi:hypothetical protein